MIFTSGCIPGCRDQAEDLKLVLEEIALTNPQSKDTDPAVFIDD
jgi:hypothetical protein